jgi:hypothetical protein
MPLKLNVGLSRKVTDNNYGSRGANVNVEMELDSSVITEPTKFQERIRQLFGMVRSSLATELNGGGHDAEKNTPAPSPNQAGGSGGSRNGGSRSSSPRPATQSQVKAIYAIARSQRRDLGPYLQAQFGVRKPEELDLKRASQVIDALKAEAKDGRCA